MMQKSEIMRRILQIVYLNFDKKMEEIELQGNRCPRCQQNNIQYPENTPKSNIHSWGDSPNFFTSHDLLCWTATCLECKTDIPIHSSYDYDIKKGFEVNSGDFFLAENGDYGHSKRNLFRNGESQLSLNSHII